jgi:hypothetical protein
MARGVWNDSPASKACLFVCLLILGDSPSSINTNSTRRTLQGLLVSWFLVPLCPHPAAPGMNVPSTFSTWTLTLPQGLLADTSGWSQHLVKGFTEPCPERTLPQMCEGTRMSIVVIGELIFLNLAFFKVCLKLPYIKNKHFWEIEGLRNGIL